MGEFIIKLPDVGEGVAEAELVEWLVEEGKNVREDEILASVMTDKATVEIPSPVEGQIKWLGPKIGEIVSVGSSIIRLEVEGVGNVHDEGDVLETNQVEEKQTQTEAVKTQEVKSSSTTASKPEKISAAPRKMRGEDAQVLASPAVRRRALDAGVDLRRVAGSGPVGRISHDDLDYYFEHGGSTGGSGQGVPDQSVIDIPVIGLRRKIAQKMSTANDRIPHITYVDEIDVTALEETRSALNAGRKADQAKLTLLPFLMKAIDKAISETPQVNSIYDDENDVIHQYGGRHIGVAAQTENGLVVPVVRHVESLNLWQCARELERLSIAAKEGTASRDELSGSTITITSLGAMGGIVTTPVINHPEVAIIGVNKIQTLPKWDGTQFLPRKIMNLSSSFDHRVIDGWDAAVFIQRIKGLIETPATIFVGD